jgi:hypothetical protein
VVRDPVERGTVGVGAKMMTNLSLDVIDLEAQTDVAFRDVSDIAVDSADNVYLLTRRTGAVVVYTSGGQYLRTWGVDRFVLPHGITIDEHDVVHIVDQGEHTVRTYTTKGDGIGVIGTPGVPSDTGVEWSLPTYKERYLSTTRGGPPFNNPTKVALAADGSTFVSDGYGNARVHHFSAAGELLHSWGEPGSEPGQFRLVHSVLVTPEGRVLVADRENDRVQSFTQDGTLLGIWDAVQRPIALVSGRSGTIVVAEMGWRVGDHSFVSGAVTTPVPPRISVLDGEGHLVARYVQNDADRPLIWRPHGLGVNPRTGRVYLAQLEAPGAAGVTSLTILD